MGFFKDLWTSWTAARRKATQRKYQFKKSAATAALAEEKRKATELHEPWVGVLRVDVDPDNLGDGAFELDWNSIFVARLVKNGYRGKNDQEIVEQWFNVVCQNVAAGNYENEIADPEKRRRIQRKQIDDNYTEVS